MYIYQVNRQSSNNLDFHEFFEKNSNRKKNNITFGIDHTNHTTWNKLKTLLDPQIIEF